MYRGSNVALFLQQPEIRNNSQLKNDFFIGCRNFIVTGCLEIKKRFDFDDVVLERMSALKPVNAMSENYRDRVPSLLPLMQSLPRIVKENEYQIIDDEWRKLPGYELPSHVSTSNDIDVFWHSLNDRQEDDQTFYSFKNLSGFTLSVLSLPHSNAECERVFSAINLIKTKTRNKLVTSTVNSLLHARQRVNKDCVSYEPSREEFSRMTSNVLYPKTTKKKHVKSKDVPTASTSANFERMLLSVIDESESDNSDSENIDNVRLPDYKK